MSLYNKIIDRQKLKMAWQRVRSNKPAAGVDGITYEEFEASLAENLAQLNTELAEHRYESLPVKMVALYKGEKKREVSLYAMRDKVVQQSISAELVKMYDGSLSKSVYAYRLGRSALQAVEMLEKDLRTQQYQWILKTDIRNFFDSIVLKRLYAQVSSRIPEEDVLQLIRACCEAKELHRDGTLTPKTVGVYQGSGIAPVLSNVYLMEFDREMDGKDVRYVRYSDDMIVLGSTREQMEEIRVFMRIRLEALGLALNEEKTAIFPAGDGTEFLGYHLSGAGKAIPAKAEGNLQIRLEQVWMGKGTTQEKLRKGAEILNGWEQYYRGERRIGSIEEFAVVVFMVSGRSAEIRDTIRSCRRSLQNTYPEICRYLAGIWKECGDHALELFEYEQYYALSGLDSDVKEGGEGPFCSLFEDLLAREAQEQWTELMQLYSDAGAFNKAAKILERIQQLEAGPQAAVAAERADHGHDGSSDGKSSVEETVYAQVDDAFIQSYLQTFAGREDTFGKEELGNGRRRCVVQEAQPLTEDVVRAHLRGDYTVSTYVQRSNGTVRFLVIDLDISKKFLLEEGAETALRNHLPNAENAAAQMLRLLRRLGLKGYPEFSGFRGFHIWVFFTEWIPTRYVNMLTDVIDGQWEELLRSAGGREAGQEAASSEEQSALQDVRASSGPEQGGHRYDDLTIEYFPNKSRLKNGSPGQCVKLPYGLHLRSGRRSMLLDEQFREISPDRVFLQDMAQCSRQAVKRIVASRAESDTMQDRRDVDRDLSGFGELTESVRVVLDRCSLMRYLCQKARTTGYLCHFERLSVLYVFGHLGEEGKQFVHTVMEFTLNYKFHVTDRFISRLPEKPISCMKLQDQYQQITAEFGCSCNFRRTKNCYPSPVLHAIKASGDLSGGVTVPTSRTISREKEKQVVEELNIHKKVEELAGKIVEMKKQKRGIDRNIQKVEKELERIYDQAGVDALEVSMGVMVRRKTNDGYEWLIEI